MGAIAWSTTRVRTFQDCRRKYYYRYHLAPLARRPDAPRPALEAGRMKDLVGVEAWAGEIVHRTIEAALNRWRAGREYGEEEAIQEAHRLLSRQYRDSRLYWDSSPESFPRKPPLLDLHYYDAGELSKERAGRLKEMVACCIRSFLRSEMAWRIRSAGPKRWLPIDRNAAARLPPDILVLVKPDFAYRDGDQLHVIDWKTGRPDPYWEMIQVTCYALYAQEQWDHPLPAVVPQIVHLYPELQVADVEFTPESVRDVDLFIRESYDELRAVSDTPGLPPVEQFPCTEDIGRCRWCAFRGLCEQGSCTGGTVTAWCRASTK